LKGLFCPAVFYQPFTLPTGRNETAGQQRKGGGNNQDNPGAE
jgi:hypothetical protein